MTQGLSSFFHPHHLAHLKKMDAVFFFLVLKISITRIAALTYSKYSCYLGHGGRAAKLSS